MWSSRVPLIVTITVVALHVHLSCAQNPIAPFIDGWTAAINSVIFPRNNTDVPVELGRKVSIAEVPYQIALYRDNYFVCGGAIISADWILTAADCVYGGGNFGIRAGSSNNAKGGQIRHVSAIVINGGYNSKTKENNIALLRVGQPFVWTHLVSPAILAGQSSNVPQYLLVTGWGSTNENFDDSEYQLRGVEVTSVSLEICKYAYLNTASVSENTLCATVPVNYACQADSGSPLAYQETLYGIQSFGAGCVRVDIPGIYTNVRRQRRWIKAAIKRFGGKLPKSFI